MTRYVVGIDAGTTFTAAAVSRSLDMGAEPTILTLGDRSSSMPTVAYVPTMGPLLFGHEAEARASTEPALVIRECTARVGDHVPIVVGERTVSAETITAATVRHVLDVAERREGTPAQLVVVTHPPGWGSYKRHALTTALHDMGVWNVRLLSAPAAAAWHFGAVESIESGQVVAVYDLGGRTFDATVLRRTADGSFQVIGTPAGIEQLGGLHFDQAVFDHVRRGVDLPFLDQSDPDTLDAMARIRATCVDAKEALSADAATTIRVALPGVRTRVRLTRGEFEWMIGDAVAGTVACLVDAIESAGVAESDVAAILMVGGSSRIPLAAQRLSQRFACSLVIEPDAQTTIALGAARYGAGLLASAQLLPEDRATDLPVDAADEERAVTVRPPDPGRPGRHHRDEHADGTPVPVMPSEKGIAGGGRHHLPPEPSRRHPSLPVRAVAAAAAVVAGGASLAFALLGGVTAPASPSATAQAQGGDTPETDTTAIPGS